MLKTEIREFMENSKYKTESKFTINVRMRELELQTQRERERGGEGGDSRKHQLSRNRTCSKFENSHKGLCRGTGCHKYGKEGHFVKDCGKNLCVYINCNQAGHVQVDCSLLTVEIVHTPTLETLHITGRRQGRVESTKVMSHDFQMTTEETRAAPDIVTSMYIFIFYVEYSLLLAYVYVFCLCAFLVNYFPALLLFDSGASQSLYPFLLLRVSMFLLEH